MPPVNVNHEPQLRTSALPSLPRAIKQLPHREDVLTRVLDWLARHGV